MKSPRKSELVNRTRFSGALDNEIYAALDTLHKKTRIPKNQLYDEAIELLLTKYEIKLPSKKLEP